MSPLIPVTAKAPPAALECTIASVLDLQADSVLEVYGSVENMRLGFEVMRDQLGRAAGARDLEITRYVSTLVVLERALIKSPERVQAIREGVIEAYNSATRSSPAGPSSGLIAWRNHSILYR